VAKYVKIFRFCVNANRIYADATAHNGYKRDLIYYTPSVRRLLLSYLPTLGDLLNPKKIFYEKVKSLGIDYYKHKRVLLKNEVDIFYYASRLKNKKIHHKYEQALADLEMCAIDIGYRSLTDFCRDNSIEITQQPTKQMLMSIDRRMNYIQYFQGIG
jgi:hypothetical protein